MSCKYCETFPKPLVDEDLHITVDDEKGMLYAEHWCLCDSESSIYFCDIHFCPMCGRKLGGAE